MPGTQQNLHFRPLAASLVLPMDCLLALTANLANRVTVPIVWTLTMTLQLLLFLQTLATRIPADLLMLTIPTHLRIPTMNQHITATRAILPQVLTNPSRLQITAQAQYHEASLIAVTHLMPI